YASRLVSQALFFKAFSHIDRLAAVAALPCRWRRIIGTLRILASAKSRKSAIFGAFDQTQSKDTDYHQNYPQKWLVKAREKAYIKKKPRDARLLSVFVRT
ncbi:hypothetical protein, partial [Aeromonas diversa]|uniref:hypothetical protein n=1 Tax=Aeromonas diversa TaxID=502790 RepID=UPI003462C0C7